MGGGGLMSNVLQYKVNSKFRSINVGEGRVVQKHFGEMGSGVRA